MAKTKISWSERVWNPITGCSKISQGCKNCYAERMAKRLAGRNGYPAAPDQFKVTLHPEKLEDPLHWKKPSMVFVDSMSDLFHKDVPDEFIYRVFKAMSRAPWHIFQVLTKRAERMAQIVPKIRSMLPDRLEHIWLGVSIEDQPTADLREPFLLKTPAAVRFISYEPALRYVNLRLWNSIYQNGEQTYKADLLHWVIMGCESGPGARPMEEEWARGMREQCRAAGVSFFYKQAMIDGKLVKLPLLDGKQWKEFPNEPRI